VVGGPLETSRTSQEVQPRFFAALGQSFVAMQELGVYCDLAELGGRAQEFDFITSGAIEGDPLPTREAAARRLRETIEGFSGPEEFRIIYEGIYNGPIEELIGKREEI
jgi:hypothetical protein